MKTVIIAAAPIAKEKFQPIYAEFPISDKILLDCIGSRQVTNETLKAGCALLGLEYESCVAGMYYILPDRECRPFELFMVDLQKCYKNAREDMVRQREAEARRRNQYLFKAILSL